MRDEGIIPFGAKWEYKFLGVWRIGGLTTGPSSRKQAKEVIRSSLRPFVAIRLVLPEKRPEAEL